MLAMLMSLTVAARRCLWEWECRTRRFAFERAAKKGSIYICRVIIKSLLKRVILKFGFDRTFMGFKLVFVSKEKTTRMEIY